MKYIRTKDELGILIEPKDNEELQKFKVGVNDMIFSTWYGNNRDNILKQADTIEELCDEFVCDNKVFHTFRGMLAYKCNANIKSYGAIWTDKGLVYVAKLNDKGELELLWNGKKLLLIFLKWLPLQLELLLEL